MSERKKIKLEDLTFEEVNAVLNHKWFMSEREGKDVGMDAALDDFFNHHAADWRKKQVKADAEAQKEEIMKHKWFLSQKLGYDVGNTPAALDWVKKGFAQHWRNRTGPYKNRK